MNGIDVVLLVLLGILVFVGVLKGMMRILIGIATLIGAFILAAQLHEGLAPKLAFFDLSYEALRLVAYVLIFIVTLVAGALIAFFMRRLLRAAMLTWADRLAGGALGLIAALLVAGLFILPLVAYSKAGEAALRESKLAPYVTVVADLANHWVPAGLSESYRRKVEDLRRYWRDKVLEKLGHGRHTSLMQDPERFTTDERAALAPYFTNLDGPVFVLVNLPEVVKGALFARYSRSAKSLRRLFLDEFLEQVQAGPQAEAVGVSRAEKLYEKVFLEYGDDSVAQLGGVHLACENCSNVLTKVLEWGRLMAYLEQSTRYVPYTGRPGGRFKYHVPDEIEGTELGRRYVETLDLAFGTYCRLLEPMQEHYKRLHPRADGVSPGVYKRTIRAKALDTLRGLLPAATHANVGIYGTGQAYEALLLRMRASSLAESRHYAELMLTELRKVIPAFLRRVDQEERGVRWSRYLGESAQAAAGVAAELLRGVEPRDQPEVVLADFDPDGETEVVAAALYASSRLPDVQLREIARGMSAEDRRRLLSAYVGERANRRHKPGRAFERTAYRFDVLADYGAFRDLQRHRMLTLEWQALSPDHGYNVAEAVEASGALEDWQRVMDSSRQCYAALAEGGLAHVAPYAVCMAFRVRFYMQMNAREAMHMLELRTAPQGHPSYRRVCQSMHELIRDTAGHPAIADAMRYVDHSEVELERLEAERAAERRRGTAAGAPSANISKPEL